MDSKCDHDLCAQCDSTLKLSHKRLGKGRHEPRSCEPHHHERHCLNLRNLNGTSAARRFSRHSDHAHNSEERRCGPHGHQDGVKGPVDAAGRTPEGGDSHGKSVENGPAETEVGGSIADAAGRDFLESDDHGPDVDKGEEKVDGSEHHVELASRWVDHRTLGDEKKSAEDDAEEMGAGKG